MAENAQTPAPGTHPDAVVINDDGSVDTRYGKGFVWVADAKTGARYDVPASMLPREGLTVVENYPVNYQPHARPPKPALVLGDLGARQDGSPELIAAQEAVAAVTSSTDPVPPPQPDAPGTDQKSPAVVDQVDTGGAEDQAGTAAGDQPEAGAEAPTTTATAKARTRATAATKAGAAGSEAGTK